jgi:hypothetical protein
MDTMSVNYTVGWYLSLFLLNILGINELMSDGDEEL